MNARVWAMTAVMGVAAWALAGAAEWPGQGLATSRAPAVQPAGASASQVLPPAASGTSPSTAAMSSPAARPNSPTSGATSLPVKSANAKAVAVLAGLWKLSGKELDDQATAVAGACGNDPAVAKGLVLADTAYEAFAPGWQEASAKLTDGEKTYDLKYSVRVPAGYDPRHSYPLLLTGHGQEGNGRQIAEGFAGLLGPAREQYIIVGPTMPDTGGFNGQAYQEQVYLRPLEWCRRNLNIDDDRIIVSGYSQGGHVSWHLACVYPHLFSAAVPMAGAPVFEGWPHTVNVYLGNLAYLPVWSIWGEKDRPAGNALAQPDFCRAAQKRLAELGIKTFKGTEIPGGGHEDCWPKADEFLAFITPPRRVTMPESINYVFHLPAHGQAYYIAAGKLARSPMDFSKKLRMEVTTEPGIQLTQAQIQQLVQQRIDKIMNSQLFRITGQLDRKANSLTITTTGLESVRIDVLDGLFDLSRPVTLKVDGKTWTGPVKPSATCLIRNYAIARDATALVVNQIEMNGYTGKATIAYPGN